MEISEKKKQEYEKYIKEITPTHSTIKDVAFAFLFGGVVCVLGQALTDGYVSLGIMTEDAKTWSTLTLVGISVLLTGFHLFAKIAKVAGAGVLVPITGFANGIASAAIEYKKEGQVFGIGCKIFTIAGPVILYGIFTSWVLGLIYWILIMIGVA